MSNEQDHAFESEIAAKMEAKGYTMVKLPELCAADFLVAKDEKVVGIIECRTRSCESTKYPTLFFGISKFGQLMQVGGGFMVPVKLVVRFADCTKWIDLSYLKTETWAKGNADRGAMTHVRSTDNEACWLIPIKDMKTL